MKFNIYPGYENHLMSYLHGDTEELKKRRQAQGAAMMSYEVPAGMKIEDKTIKGGDGQDMPIRIYTPAGLTGKAPMIIEIHGGGFVAGNLDIDNGRCIALATKVGAIVIGVGYRLSNKENHFPMPLMDCHAAYQWAQDHADELGGDAKRLGLHGSSAGGTLCAGLALYLRDRNELTPALTVTNCATYFTAIEETFSFQQMIDLKMGPDNKALGAETTFLGGYNGSTPSYYAFPGLCHDLGGLGAHLIIAAEYDTLRDGSIEYAQRLLRNGVPTEIFMGARVGHCFTAAPHPYTDLTHDLIAMAFKREFGMLDDLKKKV